MEGWLNDEKKIKSILLSLAAEIPQSSVGVKTWSEIALEFNFLLNNIFYQFSRILQAEFPQDICAMGFNSSGSYI